MRSDAQKNRERILIVASDLLRRQDFRKITMAQIAKKAQVGIGTLYRNFATKNELYLAVLYEKLNKYAEKENRYLDTHPMNLLTVKHVLRDYLTFREERLNLFPPITFAAAKNNYQSDNYQKLANLFARIFVTYQKVDKQTAFFKADVLCAALRSDIYYYQRKGRHLSKKEILEELIQLFFDEKAY